jgi:hypothetical protein
MASMEQWVRTGSATGAGAASERCWDAGAGMGTWDWASSSADAKGMVRQNFMVTSGLWIR